jgi:glucose/arabinose dehydrogenase
MGFADDGTLFLLEGGSTWPPRPYLPARILRLDMAGDLDVFGQEPLGGPRGAAVHGGFLYVADKGGSTSCIARYDLASDERAGVVDGLPDGGWHEPGGPVFGPDGLMYFAQGSVSQNGVVLPQDFTVDFVRHPQAHDVPGQDVVVTGNNVDTYDPTAPYPYTVKTGPFKPFGVAATQEEIIKGALKCSTGVWRSQPDGSELELLAWGVRSPSGMAFSEDGDLYVSDNGFAETGDRAIANDPDRIWRISKARTPHGSVTAPDWYGFPDICADGRPVWHEKKLPQRGRPAQRLIAEPPPWAGPPAFFEFPQSGMAKMDFCSSDAFGHRGRLFACEWGSLAPMTSPRPQDLDHGFKVIAVDVAKGTAGDFVHNRHPGPASAHGTGGIERPVDCKFAPDGRSLYMLDFGVSQANESKHLSYGHTGVLWRITRR